ncbi:bifunctional serine/threonine-protein kinase/glutamate ABC transporter substrate-binding protein [Streptomyces sp. NPDC057854]|uniref:bifunctional serine/threonine-protein kinase/glutamate ABC transporter substrate-binding protein n=1 Tax=unclassified Streptomyces TaxID=2593676 RepID=UPI00367E078B
MARVVDGRFELLDRLGGGGMGLVWRARDRVLHREVAVKEVRPSDPGLAEHDPAAAAALASRVLREARALARLAHPNVVTIHHVVEAAGPDAPYPWIVMELVPGGSLQERLDRGPLGPAEAAVLGRGLLAGLRAAHAAGVQHRDVKPPNVLLRPDGTPVLTDFGIASLHGSTALTPTGSVIGTPDYMAPERVRGEDGGPAADLWSLAMTLYVAVEGHNPFRRAHTLATLAAVLAEDVPPPHRAGRLGPALMAVLVRDPAARPDAAELDRLLAEAAGAPDTGPRDAVPAREPAPTSYRIAPPPPPVPANPPVPPEGPGTTGTSGPPGPADPPPPSGPPAPSGAPARPGRPRRTTVLLAAGVALALAGGGVTWALWPEDEPGQGARGAAGPSASSTPPPASASSSPSPSASDSGSGGGGPKFVIGVKADQPGLSVRRPDGTYTGFEIAVATYVARALKHDPADIVWKEVSSAERETLLGNGTVDMVVATYTVNDRREELVDFAGPYLVAHQDALVRSGDTAVRRPGDLASRTVCAVTGSTSYFAVRQVAPDAVLTGSDSYEQCVAGVASGQFDAVYTDDALLAGYAARAAYQGSFRLAGFALSEERYGIGLPEGSPLRGRVQSAIAAMVSDGSWAKALREHLPLIEPDPSSLKP